MASDECMIGQELGEKLLESIHQMNAGLGAVVYSPMIAARQRAGLSQARFAALLGVSVRTLQEWEQGRRQPSGAARTLLKVAERFPRCCEKWPGFDEPGKDAHIAFFRALPANIPSFLNRGRVLDPPFSAGRTGDGACPPAVAGVSVPPYSTSGCSGGIAP